MHNATHLDLQLHDIAASWSPDQACAHVGIILVHGPHVSWILVVVHDLHACQVHSETEQAVFSSGRAARHAKGSHLLVVQPASSRSARPLS
jgi:hypothetical protein